MAARVTAQLEPVVSASDRLVAGLSGGVDSVVLLDCLQRAARKLKFRLAALHVNHQLSPHAARWAAFCARLCRAHGIPFRSVKVKVPRGDSLEAAARVARYAAFARQPCDYIVLAHNRDDQAETLLLQLLRGAGVKGLAAMPVVGGQRSAVSGQQNPPHASRLTPHVLRPLLDVTRREILEYAKERKLKWVEDESNQDIHFQRNYLRHEVLPAIARRFPAYRATLARAARHLAEAAGLLDELAAADGAGFLSDGTLALEALRRLPPPRARNLLRHFIGERGIRMPAAERLDEALRQCLTAKHDARVLIELDGAQLRRYAGRLHLVRAARPLPPRYARRWRGERRLVVPELGGALTMERTRGAGIGVARLRGRPVSVRVRRGGERLQPDCHRPRRSLKNLLQEAHVPPWEREHLPLIFCGERLVWAAGIGVDCAFRAVRDEAAVRPVWKVPA